MEIVKSRWKFVGGSSVSSFLKALGISFRTEKDKDFWEANKVLLPEIYEELKNEVRSKWRDLHPDTGGSDEEFTDFNETWLRIKRTFVRHLPVQLNEPKLSDVTIIPEDQSIFGKREQKRKKKLAENARYDKRHPEKAKERRKRYVKKHSALVAQRNKNYRIRNRDKIRAAKKRYRQKYPEKERARKKRYVDKNPQKERLRHKRKSARWYREIFPFLPLKEKKRILKRNRVARKKYIEKNRKRKNAVSRIWERKYRKSGKLRTQKWRKENPEKVAEQNKRRREVRKKKKENNLNGTKEISNIHSNQNTV